MEELLQREPDADLTDVQSAVVHKKTHDAIVSFSETLTKTFIALNATSLCSFLSPSLILWRTISYMKLFAFSHIIFCTSYFFPQLACLRLVVVL